MKYSSVHDVLARVQSVVEFSDVPLTDINQRGMFGGTPLLVVMEWDETEGDVDAARLLLEAGAEVNAVGEDGHTPLHRAASLGKLGMVKLLVRQGASTSQRNCEGFTPLEEAHRRNRALVVEFLNP